MATAVCQPGVYGTQGVAAGSNVPGGRTGSVGWLSSNANLWVFGGWGCDSTGTLNAATLNDLWEFNPANGMWTWVSGSSTANAKGSYGTQGIAAIGNVPGCRNLATGRADNTGNFWLFGGTGMDSAGTQGTLNDLWKFNPVTKEWTWVSGSNTANATGVYGSQGVASAADVPGARAGAVSWIDGSGNFWLFGGGGLNDLWQFNPSANEWIWVSGADTPNAAGVYGTQGVPSTGNVPGARSSAVSWIDSSGNLWLFGGLGLDATGTSGVLNDLWEFNPTAKTWVWVSGSDVANAAGAYGTEGVASAANVPCGREHAAGWIGADGNLWLFGGNIYVGPPNIWFNDLWEFNPSTKTWTWMSGADTPNELGTYGTEGVPAASNVPGARSGAVGWEDASGNLWLFGGGFPGSAVYVYFNDLWRYQP
jgi:N-acetylneuraminic acid mutarotase